MNKAFPYYTITQAAAKAEESHQTLRNRISAGVVKSIATPIGRLITANELSNYLIRRGSKEGRGFYRAEDLITNTSSQDSGNNQPETPMHSDYPAHHPGSLNGCPACEAQCYCVEGFMPCVYCTNESESQESADKEESCATSTVASN